MSEAIAIPEPLVRVHEAGEEAWPLVLKTWLMSYGETALARAMRPGTFHREHHKLALSALRRSKLWVLSPAECESQYLGWLVCEPDTLHYVYVKHEYRHMGFARRLLEHAQFTQHTHDTKPGRVLVGASVYNPYLFWSRQ